MTPTRHYNKVTNTGLLLLVLLLAAKMLAIYWETAPPRVADEEMVSAICDLQPLGVSRNDATRVWQMYSTAEDAKKDIRAALKAALEAK